MFAVVVMSDTPPDAQQAFSVSWSLGHLGVLVALQPCRPFVECVMVLQQTPCSCLLVRLPDPCCDPRRVPGNKRVHWGITGDRTSISVSQSLVLRSESACPS